MSLLLKNAHIIGSHPVNRDELSHVYIEGGLIRSFSFEKADVEIDLEGKILTVGWFDLNANFNDPGNEFKEDIVTGSKCAYLGGFTDVNLSPNTFPAIESKSNVKYLLSRVEDLVDLHVTATLSKGFQGENITEILDLNSAGALSFSDGDEPIWNAELLLKALQYTSQIKASVFQNARDLSLSKDTHMHEGAFSTQLGVRGEPSLSEELIIQRDLDILKYSGGRIHFSTISTAESVNLIREAKKRKLNVSCDVSIHHLLFTDSDISDFDTTYKVKPPYRLESDRRALIEGVKEGIIDAICSHHRPQDQESKQLEFDLAEFGNTSLQTFYSSLLLIANEIPFDVLIDKVTDGPRSVLGISKVKIEVGQPAKLTILDPDTEWVLNSSTNASKSQNSPFWNKKMKGRVFGTVNLNAHLIH